MVAFLSGIRNGVVVTLAVLFHELPQEIGDFGILLYGGFTKKKALAFNFISAMLALLGGLIAFLLSESVEVFNLFFLAFSGGGFLYLASSELMPELLKQRNLKKSIIQTLIFLAGLILLTPFILIVTGIPMVWDIAVWISGIIGFLMLFLLGIFLGRVSEQNPWFYGLQTLGAGVATAVAIILLELFLAV